MLALALLAEDEGEDRPLVLRRLAALAGGAGARLFGSRAA